MEAKRIFLWIFIFLILGMTILYWYFPSDPRDFNFSLNSDTNFSENGRGMQFYKNMRFPSERISYQISEECTLKKQAEMIEAFEIMEDKTILEFYPALIEPEISVICDDKIKIENGMFIAGEGGPANVSLGENFSVIRNGHILLIRESSCERPNIAIHELLHVLGFDHSENINNIMYPISKCRQEISEDMIDEINRLYSIPSLPDIAIEKVSAELKNRFLSFNLTIQNEGLKESGEFVIEIFANDKLVETLNVDAIPLGSGREITVTNVFISKINVEKLEFSIKVLEQELDKINNIVTLELS